MNTTVTHQCLGSAAGSNRCPRRWRRYNDFFPHGHYLAFLWPLRSAHAVLAAEKQRLQGETVQRLATTFTELDRRVDAGELKDIGAVKTAIDSLRAKQEVIAKLSTWPWQIETVRGLAATMALPLLIWIAQRVLELFIFVQ